MSKTAPPNSAAQPEDGVRSDAASGEPSQAPRGGSEWQQLLVELGSSAATSVRRAVGLVLGVVATAALAAGGFVKRHGQPAAQRGWSWTRGRALPYLYSEAWRTVLWTRSVLVPAVARRSGRAYGGLQRGSARGYSGLRQGSSQASSGLRRGAAVTAAAAPTALRTARSWRVEHPRRPTAGGPRATRSRQLAPPYELPPAQPDNRPWVVKASHLLIGTIAGALALVLVATALGPRAVADAGGAVDVSLRLPEVQTFGTLAEGSVVYAADGSVLGTLDGEIQREVVSLERIPRHVRQAVIAAEDRDFYDHSGYDVEGIGRAALANARARTVTQGGSTITQQLAKLNFVGDDVTLERKISELLYAMALEEKYTKNELLERYLNEVYFGAGAYGIQAASEEFFGVGVDKLKPAQGALLAGMIRSPSSLDPRRNRAAAKDRRNSILAAMATMGAIKPAQLDKLQASKLTVIPNQEERIREPYVVEAVKQEFFDNPAFGATYGERIDKLFEGGVEIHTTVSPGMQDKARAVIADYYPEPGGRTAAIASVDPRSGAVRAMHSGQSFEQTKFNVALQGRRQPGSAIKPLVMAEALSQGFPPQLTLPGKSPITVVYDEGRQVYEPINFGGSSYGSVDMVEGLRRSINTYFVQLTVLAGIPSVIDMASQLGIEVEEAFGETNSWGPAIGLGGVTHGITPMEMASAYGTFANQGKHVEPYFIESVSEDGEVIYKHRPEPQQVLNPQVNAVAVDMLQGVVEGGTGTAAALSGWNVAGKTGTTQNSTDVWFVGFTPVLSTAVWVGHPEGRVEMPGATGGVWAAPIWQDFMTLALEGVEPVDFAEPEVDLDDLFDAEVDVPDVLGLDSDEALQRLAAAKLIGQIVMTDSLTPEGEVIGQSPDGDDTATVGEEVTIFVSTGEDPRVRVPNVLGREVSAAVQALEAAGLGASRSQVESDLPAGTVVSQSPDPGTLINPGSAVTLGVSSGPPPPPEEEPTPPPPGDGTPTPGPPGEDPPGRDEPPGAGPPGGDD